MAAAEAEQEMAAAGMAGGEAAERGKPRGAARTWSVAEPGQKLWGRKWELGWGWGGH